MMWPLVLLLAPAALAIGLVDDPVVGSARQSLDGLWSVQLPSGAAISGSVPGDLLTDMERANVIGDPLFGNNFDFFDAAGKVAPPPWEQGNVTYTTSFTLDAALANASEILLVLDGIKMASGVWLNGHYLGTTANQFVRWRYPVAALLAPRGGANTLAVAFPPATDAANAQARFMACSGGWDWAREWRCALALAALPAPCRPAAPAPLSLSSLSLLAAASPYTQPTLASPWAMAMRSRASFPRAFGSL